ncbi:MAG: ribbon-helix-helix protein, CopG family [Fimbriimonadales bacterium]
MKSNTKSSVTLPEEAVALIEKLQRRLEIPSKVEVVRRALRLLDESSERIALRERYREAAYRVRESAEEAIHDYDHLASEGLDED